MPQLSVNSRGLWLLAIRTLPLCPFFSPQLRHYSTHISGVLFWTKTGSLTASKAALKSCQLEPWLLFSSCCILEQPHIDRPTGLLHELNERRKHSIKKMQSDAVSLYESHLKRATHSHLPNQEAWAALSITELLSESVSYFLFKKKKKC